MSFWLLGKHAVELKSSTHLYVFVTLRLNQRPEFHALLSEFVSNHVYEQSTKSGTWYSFDRSNVTPGTEGWDVFGDPHLQSELLIDPTDQSSD
jgi:hypothetical protein